jgi:EmrB/QacA subfamily drug resistance transporter
VVAVENISEQRVALLVTTLSSLLTPMMGSAVNIAMPAIAKEFAMDAILLSWVASAYLLAAAVFLLPFGRLADIVGRKKIFSWGTAVFTAASLLAALAPTAQLFICARVLQGIGSAMIFGTGIAILTSVFPPQRRGWVLGINVAATYSGLSLGPFVGGLLTQHLGWRSLFLVVVPLGFLILAAVRLKMPQEWRESRGENFDWPGSLVYCLMLTAFMFGFTLLPRFGGLALILVALAALPILLAWEIRTRYPIFPAGLIKGNPVFAFSNLAALINYSATFALTFLLSLYLQYIKGLPPGRAGLILIAQPIVMAVFSPVAGRLSDRLEPRLVASLGMGISSAGLFLFIWLNRQTAMGVIVAGLILVGFGFALFSSPNTNAVMGAVEKKYYGVAAATLSTMRMVGQMLSMGIATLIFSHVIGKAQITPASYALFLESMKVSFVIFSILCGTGVFFSLARGRMH